MEAEKSFDNKYCFYRYVASLVRSKKNKDEKENDLEDAYNKYRSTDEIIKENDYVYYLLKAFIEKEHHNLEGAKELCEKAKEKKGDEEKCEFLEYADGLIPFLEMRYDEALIELNGLKDRMGTIYKRDFRRISPELHIAYIYMIQRNYSEAEKIYDELRDIPEGRISAEVHHGLGQLEMEQGQFKKAEDYFVKAIGLSGGCAKTFEGGSWGRPYYDLGLLYFKKKDYKKAEECLERAKSLFGDSDYTFYKKNSRNKT